MLFAEKNLKQLNQQKNIVAEIVLMLIGDSNGQIDSASLKIFHIKAKKKNALSVEKNFIQKLQWQVKDNVVIIVCLKGLS